MGSGAGSFLKVLLKNFDVLAGYVFLFSFYLLYQFHLFAQNSKVYIFFFFFYWKILIVETKGVKI